jgi:hypothetical protein
VSLHDAHASTTLLGCQRPMSLLAYPAPPPLPAGDMQCRQSVSREYHTITLVSSIRLQLQGTQSCTLSQ